MADLSLTYSKTPKGLRARSSFIGGLSGKLMKVLVFIDGTSKAESILTKHDDISADKLLQALAKLEADGYIKPVAVSSFNDEDDWDLGSSSQQMVVEELGTEEIADMVQTANEDVARLEAERSQKDAEKLQQAQQV